MAEGHPAPIDERGVLLSSLLPTHVVRLSAPPFNIADLCIEAKDTTRGDVGVEPGPTGAAGRGCVLRAGPARAKAMDYNSVGSSLGGELGTNRMPYLRLFYHMIWATKDRQPFIEDAFSSPLHRCISGKAIQLGATGHAVGGIEDHIHMAVSVPPSVALSEFVRHVKGSSSHFMNHELSVPVTFAWQGD